MKSDLLRYSVAPFGNRQKYAVMRRFLEEKIEQAEKFAFLQSNYYFEKDLYDSQFYGFPVLKLLFCENACTQSLVRLSVFLREKHSECYFYAELPSEEINALAAFGDCGFRLTESRLSYFTENFQLYTEPKYASREASEAESELLAKIAQKNSNPYDRHHAEICFKEKADDYLAEYVRRSVIHKFSDSVLVPNLPFPDAFMCVNQGFDKKTGTESTRPVLSAVGAKNRGWHFKLLYSALHFGAKNHSELAYMNTQTTNKAVLRNFEKLSLRYGTCKHLFGKKIQNPVD
jgi:hypothetical protein